MSEEIRSINAEIIEQVASEVRLTEEFDPTSHKRRTQRGGKK
jgi:hypothetical protein